MMNYLPKASTIDIFGEAEKKMYQEKLATAEELSARIGDGWVIGTDAAAAYPVALLTALAGRARQDAVKGVKIQTLLDVFQKLIDRGATVVVIEHDLDVIRNADYVIDMGPGGGEAGGRIVFTGTPEELCGCPESKTGQYLLRQ